MKKQLKRLVTVGMVACLSVVSSMMAFADNEGMNVGYDREWLKSVNVETVDNFSGTYENTSIIGDGLYSAPPVFIYNPKYVYSGYIQSDNQKVVGVYWIEDNIINITYMHTYFDDYDTIARRLSYNEKNANAQFVVDGDYLISLSHLTDISIPSGETFDLLKTEELYYGGMYGVAPGYDIETPTDKVIQKLQWKSDGTFTITYDGDTEAYQEHISSISLFSPNLLTEFYGTYKKVGNEIQIYGADGALSRKYYDYKGRLVESSGFLKKIN